MVDVFFWILIALAFFFSFVSLVYPILPGVLFLLGGYLLYGLFFGFHPLDWMFWVIQGVFVILLFAVDYLSNMYGVKKWGGSRAAVWGSTIGLIIGPFVLPLIGILLGPFIGAVIAELLVHQKGIRDAAKVGVGTLFGFLGGAFVKAVLQIVMILLFFNATVWSS